MSDEQTQGMGVPASPSGCEATPSAAEEASSQSRIPNARLSWQGGKCRVPMWSMGVPDGFCDAPAFGEQHPKAILYAQGYSDRNRVPYCHGPCCPAHGGPKEDGFRFFPDGLTAEGRLMWCCVGPDFENLQESPAGFDGNPITALANYRIALASVDRSPEGQDAQRLDAKHESAVAKPDAQNTPKETSHD
jgi:hypothetical protein